MGYVSSCAAVKATIMALEVAILAHLAENCCIFCFANSRIFREAQTTELFMVVHITMYITSVLR